MKRFALVLLGTAAGLVAPNAAMADEKVGYVDVSGSLGFSRNPFLTTPADGSIFARGSLFGSYQITGERSSTMITAFGENSFYLNDSDSQQLARVNVSHNYKASETVTLFGGLAFSLDNGSQLSTRFLTLPQPLPTDPDIIIDPALLGRDTRSYRLSGNLGATVQMSERDTVSLTAADEQVWYGNGQDNLNFNSIFVSTDWNRTLSERSSLGARASAQFADYAEPGRKTQVYTLQGTLSRFLTQNWQAKIGVGASYSVRDDVTGSDSSISPAVDLSLCRRLPTEDFCANARHGVQTSVGEAIKSTEIGFTYSKRLNSNDSWNAGASASRSAGGSVPSIYYVTAAAGYNHRFSDRLSGSVDASVRDIFRKHGDNVPFDATASVSIHYRIGDLPR
jgi:hypothetical protein